MSEVETMTETPTLKIMEPQCVTAAREMLRHKSSQFDSESAEIDSISSEFEMVKAELASLEKKLSDEAPLLTESQRAALLARIQKPKSRLNDFEKRLLDIDDKRHKAANEVKTLEPYLIKKRKSLRILAAEINALKVQLEPPPLPPGFNVKEYLALRNQNKASREGVKAIIAKGNKSFMLVQAEEKRLADKGVKPYHRASEMAITLPIKITRIRQIRKALGYKS